MSKSTAKQPLVFNTNSFTPAQRTEIDSFVRALRDRITELEKTITTASTFTWTNARVIQQGDNLWFQVKDRVDGLWRTIYTKSSIIATAKDGEQ